MEYAGSPYPLLADAPVSDTAVELRASAQKVRQERFFTLPFNHYDPDNSPWWVLNSNEKRAYRFGKIIVTKDRDVVEPAERFIGLHVEKGVEGERAARTFEVAHGEALVMTDKWRWHEFVAGMRSGRVAEQAVEAESAAGRPLTVAVIAGYQRLPDRERPHHRSPDFDADVSRFVCQAGRLTPIQGTRRNGRLDRLAEATSFAAIAAEERSIREVDFVWIEVLIGLRFGLAPNGGSGDVWSARNVWDRVCQPWQNWVA